MRTLKLTSQIQAAKTTKDLSWALMIAIKRLSSKINYSLLLLKVILAESAISFQIKEEPMQGSATRHVSAGLIR